MKKIITLLLLATALLSASEKAYFTQFEIINIHDDYKNSVSRLFKDYLEESGKYQLIYQPSKDTLTQNQDQLELQKKATEAQAKFYIMGTMNRLNQTVVVSIGLYETETNNLVWKGKDKVNNPDDLDFVMQKMARAFGDPSLNAAASDIYTVTDMEGKALRKVDVAHAFGASVGSAFIFNNLFSNDPFVAGGGLFWYYDARTILFEIDAQAYLTGTNSLAFASIALYKPLSSSAQTPFIGGGMGISTTSVDYRDEYYRSNGLIAYLGGGYVLNRMGNVGFRIHGRAFVDAYKLNDTDRTMPFGVLLNLEIYFAR